jgi:hypothetical protein
MEDIKTDELEELEKPKKKKQEEELPFCTTAPSAEHTRAHDEDEPCDDGTEGDTKPDVVSTFIYGRRLRTSPDGSSPRSPRWSVSPTMSRPSRPRPSRPYRTKWGHLFFALGSVFFMIALTFFLLKPL